MKIFYIGVSLFFYLGPLKAPSLMPAHQILRNESKPAHELCVEKDLSSYSRFTRDKYDIIPCLGNHSALTAPLRLSYGQFMSLFSKTVAERTKPGQRQDVEEKCTAPPVLTIASSLPI